MKKQFLSILGGAALIATVFSGCSKKADDTTPPPVPTISALTIGATTVNTATLAPGEFVSVALTAAGPSGVKLKSMSVSYTLNGGPKTPITIFSGNTASDTTFATQPTSYSKTIKLGGTATKDDVLAYTFTVTDANGGVASATFTITTKAPAGGLINTYTAVLMGAQNNATKGSFYATSTNTVYLIADAKANASKVDFVYFYGATNLATVASPSDADASTVFNTGASALSTWSVHNATLFKLSSVSTADFDAATDDTKLVSEGTSATASKVNSLAVNSVIAFKTAAGKYGLAKVTQVDSNNSGTITLVVKVQQ